MAKITVTVNAVKQTGKPQNPGVIQNAFKDTPSRERGDLGYLKKAIENGYTFKPYILKNCEFVKSNLLVLDIDNNELYISMDKFLNKLKENDINPYIWYHTFGSKEKHEKFRVILRLEVCVEDEKVYKGYLEDLCNMFPEVDNTIVSSTRMYYGTNKQVFINPKGIYKPIKILKTTNYTPLPRDFDLFDYINVEQWGKDYNLLDPCPVCEGFERVRFFSSDKSYYCFGATCNKQTSGSYEQYYRRYILKNYTEPRKDPKWCKKTTIITRDKDGNITKIKPCPILYNFKQILQHHNTILAYDEISQQEFILNKQYTNKRLEDVITRNDIKSLVLPYEGSLKFTDSLLSSYITEVAGSNVVNPVADFFKSCKYDPLKGSEIERVARAMTTDDEMVVVNTLMLKKFLHQAYNLITGLYRNSNFCLILYGKNGEYGKSTFIQYILPPHLRHYAKVDWNINTQDKDTKINALKYAFCELGEGGSLFDKNNQKGLESFKSFITGDIDQHREAYGRKALKNERKTSFTITTNAEKFLTSTKGARRFLTLHVDRAYYKHLENPMDLEQLWGEIGLLNCNHKSTTEEQKMIEEQAEKVAKKSDLDLKLDDLFDISHDKKEFMTQQDIEKYLKEVYGKDIKLSSLQTKLLDMGVEHKPRYKNRRNVYFIKKAKIEEEFDL